MEHHAARAREFLSHEYDRITPLEEPLPVEARIVVLQLESFGGKAMDATHQGQWVMPFMRDLKEHSMFFRLKAFHKNGSCDMDFAATTFTEPYPGLVPYRVPGIKYTNAMPAFLKRFGFQTYFYHGNTSLFYDRGLVLDSLGFDHLVFREQLAPMRLPASTIGIRDAALLGTMLKSIQSENRGYFFAITLDTHSPYLQLSPDEMELFPAPSNEAERYLNALRYLDKCLKEFVAQLPPGTTLLMYGDHTTSLVSEEFTSDVVDGKEYVACYICKKGSDLAQIQRTRQQSIATDGSFNVLDVMSYLRHSIEARNATPQTRVIADRARS
jgi:hypothetical protein